MTKKILKIYVGDMAASANIKLPLPFLKTPDDFKSKLGEIVKIDSEGFAIIELNEAGEKHFSEMKSYFSTYEVKLPNEIKNFKIEAKI